MIARRKHPNNFIETKKFNGLAFVVKLPRNQIFAFAVAVEDLAS